MSKPTHSWEDVLFCPPPWPYAKDDASAPAAHPTIKRYGYDIQALGTLPVQEGYEKPSTRISGATRIEAKQYYTQLQVFRDIMLDKQWAARQRESRPISGARTSPCRQGSDTGHQLPADASTDNAYLRNTTGRPRDYSSSVESSSTAVSQGSDADDGHVFSELQAKAKGKESGQMCTPQARPSPGRSHGVAYAILRIPMLCFILLVITMELLVYFVLRQTVALYEKVFIRRGRLGRLFVRLRAASSYQEYLGYAKVIDAHMGVDMDDVNAHSCYYDAPLLLRITESLREMRATAEQHQENASIGSGRAKARSAIVSLCDLLSQGALKANAGGWENRQVWSQAYSGAPRVVDDYIDETVASIKCVRESPYMSAPEKVQFFRQIARQQGRMALCLSGGAAMGWKHLGVARCLLDEARLPRVISGTSMGSIVAALLGTHTDSELRQIIRPELAKYVTAGQGSEWQRLVRWLTKGCYFDIVEGAPRAQAFTRGSLTFLEAYERTGKLLNIACTPLGPRCSPRKLLNHITAPNVIIWSAVLASACIPGFMQPMVLLMKTRDGRIRPYTDSGAFWRDGSFSNDIPSTELRTSLNVQFTVVSQVNPHVSLFFYDRNGSIGQPLPARHSSSNSSWRGGFIASAIEHMLKLDIRKWLRLLFDLRLMPMMLSQDWSLVWLQKFDGNVTILPQPSVPEYFRLLRDPTNESLARSMQAGEIATWPKLKLIKARQAVEDAITKGWVEACYACTRSSQLKKPVSPKTAVATAAAAKATDRPDQQARSRPLGSASGQLGDKDSTALHSMHSMCPQSSSRGPKRPVLRRRGRQSQPRKQRRPAAPPGGRRKQRSAADDDHKGCSSSIAND
ncbi:hypothetical protein IWW50_003136 [Coemansia erecta]|nr:hypothetical protein IWW50_003136 [Coemansia erecta]